MTVEKSPAPLHEDEPTVPRHGGDLSFATARHGEPVDGWLDLSTGVNPHPYLLPPPSAVDVARLPEPAALRRLIEAARRAYGIADGVPLVATPGSEIAIRLLPLVAPPGPVAIFGPTYGSHADAWHNAGRTVVEVDAPGSVPAGARIIVLANPNNPDGRQLAAESIINLCRRIGTQDGVCVIDEAFGDVAPELSIAPHLAGLSAIVLRSFGKFFGLPGLRLGFAAGHPGLVAKLAGLLGEWPVSGPAISTGTAALSDRAWQENTRTHLRHDAARLRAILAAHRLSVTGSTDLFVLGAHPEAHRIHEGLAARGVWTRVFDYRRDWLRIGLPGTDAGFDRLDVALAAAMPGR